MKHSEGYIKGEREANIYYQNWLPDGEVKASILISHGMGEHSGRYLNIAEYFIPKGFGVYALDHYGHGKSDGTRVHVEKFQDLTIPLRTYSYMILDQHPGKPLFLMGQSLGALIGTAFLLEDQTGFTGAIFTAAGVKLPENITPLTVVMAKILSVVMPKAGAAQMEYQYLSQDQKLLDAFYNDPLVYTGKTTARLGTESLRIMQRIDKEGGKIILPLLILHGEEDKLVALGAAKHLAEKVGSEDKTLKIYKGHWHDLLHDTGVEEVLADIEEWIEKRL